MYLKYFAYGSNMHPQRLADRIGHFGVHGTARLSGWRLAFHKRGGDGSGKCDIVRTDDPAHAVHGVVYDIHVDQKQVLDGFEGLGRGYDEATLMLDSGRGPLEAVAYVAHDAHIDATLRPFEWYKLFVLEGARRHRLPAHYVSYIEQVPHRDDPDAGRDALNRNILTHGA